MDTSPAEWRIAIEGTGEISALFYEGGGSPTGASLVLAHGAGAGQRSPFLVSLAQALAFGGLDVVTFNFPYMESGRKLPDRRPVLEASFTAVINAATRELPARRLFIGGKSMGGRIATHVCAALPDLPVAGLVLLGYPLHPPGRPGDRRDGHLKNVRRPTLIVQGSRDAFGTPGELEPALATMVPRPTLHIVAGGDHSFTVRRTHGVEQTAVHEEIQRAIAEWVARVVQEPAPGRAVEPSIDAQS